MKKTSIISVLLLNALFAFSQTVSYQYDNLNRLSVVSYSNGSSITYTYDELGNRTKKVVTGMPSTIEVTSVTLNKETLTLSSGTQEQLVATISPSDATNQQLTWQSSNPNVATVDQDGRIVALQNGTTTITVSSNNGIEATCLVTVIVPVTEISLNRTEITLNIDESELLIATILPENATNKQLTWQSSDSSVATVDQNGRVVAKQSGTTTITASSNNGIEATCLVSIIVPVTDISLNKAELELDIYESVQLIASILPENATDKQLTWQSNDSNIATVDQDGRVVALQSGTATITVSSNNGIEATCLVTVTVPVNNVNLNKTEITLNINESEQLIATIFPENATNKQVTWQSSNPSIATVDQNGWIVALQSGTTTITVSSNNGKTAVCEVVVETNIIQVENITLDENATMKVGETLQLTATIIPSNATNQNIIWASTNTTIATVENGNVYAISDGNVTITATTEDGNKVASCDILVLESVNIENPESDTFIIYPNPAKDYVIIKGVIQKKIIVRNSIGSIVLKHEMLNDEEIIPISDWATGIYLIQIIDNGMISKTIKLIKE